MHPEVINGGYSLNPVQIVQIVFYQNDHLISFSNYWKLLSQRASGENGNE